MIKPELFAILGLAIMAGCLVQFLLGMFLGRDKLLNAAVFGCGIGFAITFISFVAKLWTWL